VGGVGAELETPLASDALIRTRDGIAGTWQQPLASALAPLTAESPDNLERWSPAVRASVIDFELFSRLGFRADPPKTPNPQTMHLWHLDAGNSGATPPGVLYRPLASMTRPPIAVFEDQLPFLDHYADLRADRASEILAQLTASTTFLGSIAWLRPDRTRWTIELLAAAFRLANFVEMRFKHGLACRRAVEFSPQVQPMIATPGHASLPSGHATEAFTASTVLWLLFRRPSPLPVYGADLWGEELMRLASRIAINRTIAGMHFPIDSVAGAFLGLTLGHYVAARCTHAATYEAWRFDGTSYPTTPANSRADTDFNWRRLYDVSAKAQIAATNPATGGAYVTSDGAQPFDTLFHSPILEWLWTKARGEWT
jgi:membrane-associated phospholipid phosphatase